MLRRCLILLSFLLFVPGALAQQMPLVQLTAGMYRITAEMANTPKHRETGLMHRESMGENRGMVFVFEFDATHCMWMRNTLIPLSVAFLDGDGKVINIEDMAPQTETTHCAKRPARYALEMNQGWFAQRGIVAGDLIGGVAKLRPAR
ncbi:MAG: DUF192 domain-containing protein [Pseudazoarcus pumilus]|nr:DUF192 domain-containing protein [Pseudazoarcus pumilus]